MAERLKVVVFQQEKSRKLQPTVRYTELSKLLVDLAASLFFLTLLYSKRRILTSDELEQDTKIPAPLTLPTGKLFFGFPVVPHQPKPKSIPEGSSTNFAGTGNTLSSRTLSPPGPQKGKEVVNEDTQSTKNWGTGQTLGTRRPAPTSHSKAKPPVRQRSPTPDWGVDDDDVIAIDSD